MLPESPFDVAKDETSPEYGEMTIIYDERNAKKLPEQSLINQTRNSDCALLLTRKHQFNQTPNDRLRKLDKNYDKYLTVKNSQSNNK